MIGDIEMEWIKELSPEMQARVYEAIGKATRLGYEEGRQEGMERATRWDMMNKIGYLLVCLMEEAAEIQQAAANALMFGLANHHPERNTTNCIELSKEIGDLNAVVEMLNAEHAIDTSEMLRSALRKAEKVERFMRVSKECGRLE